MRSTVRNVRSFFRYGSSALTSAAMATGVLLTHGIPWWQRVGLCLLILLGGLTNFIDGTIRAR
jgi:phosphatidylglycerophosphate synthase